MWEDRTKSGYNTFWGYIKEVIQPHAVITNYRGENGAPQLTKRVRPLSGKYRNSKLAELCDCLIVEYDI